MKSSILILIATVVLFSCKRKGADQEIVSERVNEKPFILDQLTDTVFIENVTVSGEDGNWIFKNKVQGQNNWRTFRFTLVVSSENTIRFSNPKHYFSKYNRIQLF